MSPDVSDLSDVQLLTAVGQGGSRLLESGKQRLAQMGDVPDDSRWGVPLPIRVELVICDLFLGVLDAFAFTADLLQRRASQQAFSGLRFQTESVALLRWMTDPEDENKRQHRAYRMVCGQIRRWEKAHREDAGEDAEALQGVQRIQDWGIRLREIAQEDGIPNLKEAPKAKDLFAYRVRNSDDDLLGD